ncbi:MAG: bifunctional diguanylate cyclase/phosphodiesterase [Cohaesibacter sp.]|nr:bifunctional diguanylate cyclase/phosphodiesterase [Cohaesibacter sp.]
MEQAVANQKLAAKARDILTSIGEVVYDWAASGDRLRWSSNSNEVLGFEAAEIFATGKQFSALITPDTIAGRYRSIFGSGTTDDGNGVPFACLYCLAPDGLEQERRVWVEECGRWFAGADGRAKHVHGVLRVVDEQYQRQQRLLFLSQFDELTGLYNRSFFCDQLSQSLRKVKEKDLKACFLIAHIDNFRVVNEAYGFDIADQVIREVASRISRRLRDGDLVGRVSGTKFGLLINHCSEQEMPATAERFLEAIREELIMTQAGPIHVTLTMGGVALGDVAKDLRTAQVCALDALDRAKHHHRGSFRSFNAAPFAMDEREHTIKMAHEVIGSLNERRIALAFQPIVRSDSEQTAFYEVLLRVDDSDGQAIPAGQFVDFAEKLGLAGMLDHRILEMTLDVLFSYPDAHLSINVSPDVGMDEQWRSYLKARIGNCPDVAERLIVEITETAAIRHMQEAVDFVKFLQKLGCRVAIDDFGAGYTSFRNLQALKVDLVKIDGSFVQDVHENAHNRAFVRMFTELAKELDLDVVAEWVESEEVADLLEQMGVDYLQGYHFGKASLTKPWLSLDECSGQSGSDQVVVA